MKKFVSFLFIIVSFPFIANYAQETRELDNFDRVEISGAFQSVIDASAGSSEIIISGADDIIEKIITEVSGNTLKIYTKDIFSWNGIIRLDIKTRSLEELHVSGSNTVSASGIDESGFELKMSGSGDVKLEGKTGGFEAKLSGSAKLDAASFKAKDVELKTSGSSEVSVYAEDSIEIKASGSSEVDVYGDPEEFEQKTSGSTTIRRK